MHKELRERLRDAKGASEFVAAVNIDIRGFSSFFNDSSQAAAYLSAAYTHILDDYFPDVDFFKPTGDGLLLVKVLDQATGQDAVVELVESALRLNEGFDQICANDWMINYPTPQFVGIGIARGTATRIEHEGFTLDYSGLPLNLASRLMDMARPQGVVFDENLGISALPKATLKKFDADSVYIRGVAESEPIAVYFTSDVRLSPERKRPFGSQLFQEPPIERPLSQLRQNSSFAHRLTFRPADPSQIRVGVGYPASKNGRKLPYWSVDRNFPHFMYYDEDGDPRVSISYEKIVKWVGDKCKGTWPIRIKISYPALTADIQGDEDREN